MASASIVRNAGFTSRPRSRCTHGVSMLNFSGVPSLRCTEISRHTGGIMFTRFGGRGRLPRAPAARERLAELLTRERATDVFRGQIANLG